MTDVIPEAPSQAMRVISRRPQGVVLAEGNAVVGIHQAPLYGERLLEVCRGIQQQAAGGLVLLGVFRLSRRFPLAPGFDSNTQELAAQLRGLDRSLVACANLLEFGGFRAAAMKVAVRAVCMVARPRAAISQFDRMSDALTWLTVQAQRAGTSADPAVLVRLYRTADQRLQELEHAAHSPPPG